MKNERLIKNLIVLGLIFITLWFGFRPLFLGTSYKNYTRLDKKNFSFGQDEYATIVFGSEPEGIASALACARTGLKTLLITSDPDLGSYIKKSLISSMDPQEGLISGKKVPLNRGIYQEIFGKFNIGFTGEDYRKTVTNLVEKEKSLEVVYDSHLFEVDLSGETLKGVIVEQPDGKHYYKARNFIDATREGQLLALCQTPYFSGSEDLGLKASYSSLEFNFVVSGVDVEALKKSRKTSDFIDEFQMALLAYRKINPRTKLVSPSFISQGNDELVITGLKVFGVNVADDKDLKAAYIEAEDEAKMLTAYLKTALVAFKSCNYKESPAAFFIPEYRHYKGRTQLTVTDILENRDFNNKIALASGAVNAEKFVRKDTDTIVVKPNVYAIPLGSIIPVNLQNVLMTGGKASFSSLAATSAGSLPTRITVGESAGLVCAYSFINMAAPAQLLDLKDKELYKLTGYLARGNINLDDFTESILIPKTEQKLSSHWAYLYVKTLVDYGLIAGGDKNDFKLDYKASQELFAVLLKNVAVKMIPELYDLDFDKRVGAYESKDVLTGEKAAAIVLDALKVPFGKGEALKALKEKGFLPAALTGDLTVSGPVTLDVVYGLAVETVKYMAHQ